MFDTLDDAFALLRQILKWVDEGLSMSDIGDRIKDPSTAGGAILARVVGRRKRGKDLLGRG